MWCRRRPWSCAPTPARSTSWTTSWWYIWFISFFVSRSFFTLLLFLSYNALLFLFFILFFIPIYLIICLSLFALLLFKNIFTLFHFPPFFPSILLFIPFVFHEIKETILTYIFTLINFFNPTFFFLWFKENWWIGIGPIWPICRCIMDTSSLLCTGCVYDQRGTGQEVRRDLACHRNTSALS